MRNCHACRFGFFDGANVHPVEEAAAVLVMFFAFTVTSRALLAVGVVAAIAIAIAIASRGLSVCRSHSFGCPPCMPPTACETRIILVCDCCVCDLLLDVARGRTGTYTSTMRTRAETYVRVRAWFAAVPPSTT